MSASGVNWRQENQEMPIAALGGRGRANKIAPGFFRRYAMGFDIIKQDAQMTEQFVIAAAKNPRQVAAGLVRRPCWRW